MQRFDKNDKPNQISKCNLDDSFQLPPMLTPSRRSSKYKIESDQIIYDVIIIGAGISGLLAADILLRQEKNVLVLQTKSSCGGSIKQQSLGDMINPHQQPEWMKKNQINEIKVQVGTAQLMSDHSNMVRLCQQLDLTLTPMYSDGKIIYAQSQTSIKTILSPMQIYFTQDYKKTISKLLAKIQNISKNILQVHDKIINNPGKNHYLLVLKQYVEKFDNMTVREFFNRQIQNQHLRNMVINEFQIVQSIQVDKISMFHVFLHQYGLQNLKYFTQMKSQLTQPLRIKQGNLQLTQRLKRKIQKKQKKMELQLDVIRFNQTVIQINNQINKQVEVITNQGNYKCFKVFFSATMDSANKVKISKLSDTKRLVLDNQQQGNLQRAFLLFQTAFWRSKYSGRGLFSDQMPVSQMIDVSPSNLACGILCLVICGSKNLRWQQKFSQFKDQISLKTAQTQYLSDLVSRMFLNGNKQSRHLKNMQMYMASSNQCYQSFTKIGIANLLQHQGQDYLECYIRDQHNIIFLGSQLSKKFGSYMEGAIRHTRQQIYRYLEVDDPWGKL